MIIFDNMLKTHTTLLPCKNDIARAYKLLKQAYEQGGKVLVCGNGGSAADCEHIVGELMKGFKMKRPIPAAFRIKLSEAGGSVVADYLQRTLPAISLVSQTALMTAFSNDLCFDYIFAQQVYGYGKKGDVLIAISTSGNAVNVLNAVYVARALGMNVLGMSGADGGTIKDLCDVCLCVPAADTASVQEMHLPVYHALCASLEDAFFGKNEDNLNDGGRSK